MAFVSTLGADNANSFISIARATSLLTELPDSPGVVAWLALDETAKQKTLVASTMTINPLRWKGFVATADQSLAWPRKIKVDGRRLPIDELPLDLEYAVAYMAAFLTTSGGYTGIQDGNDGGIELKQNDQYEEVELGNGALRVKYKPDKNEAQSGFEYIPPFVMDILSKYIVDSSFNQSYVSRTSAARITPFYAGGAYGSRIRFVNGAVFPAYGGWASNPL